MLFGDFFKSLNKGDQYTYIIGEIGINHNGSIETAKKLIDMAKDANCDAVKFQKRDLDIVYGEEILNQKRESPWGTTQRDQKSHLEFNYAEYQEIDDYCKNKGIEWSASAWDKNSQNFLRNFQLPFNKIASAMLSNTDFVNHVASEKKFTLASTGMCDMKMIEDAIKIFQKNECPVMLMHTVSEYPCPTASLNLKMIKTLKEKFNLPVGYSGHETSVSPSIIAAVLGAKVIERHITLDRSMYGSDQSASLESQGLRQMVGAIRKIYPALGTGIKEITDGEIKVSKKLRYWNN